MASRLQVTHVITGLPRGGAQTVLEQLVLGADRARFEMDVISLTELGAVGERLARNGTRVRALAMNRRLPNPAALLRLARWLRRSQTHVVQTWLYHGDLIGGLAGRLAGVPVMWNLRQTDLDPKTTGRGTLWTARACAPLSRRVPRRIVCCSEASQRVHAALGYDASRMVVVCNGVDLGRFRPDRAAAAAFRAELGVGPGERLVGLFARYHPQKDHQTFIAAAAAVCRAVTNVRFMLCGEAIDGCNAELASLLDQAGCRDRFLLLGIRDDVPRLTAALDLAVSSSSYAEGFSNVLLEAMAAGVPCVATDVGESALMVGDSGWVVPPRDVAVMTEALLTALRSSDPELVARGARARARAQTHYSLATMIETYQNLYAEVAAA
jgi:glycosyltransferase involved in cell wall biosynthesis